MQKLTYIFIGIVLLLFVLSGLYIRSSESEKQVLRAQLAAQQVPESSSRDLQEEQVEEISSDDTASAAAAPQKPLGKIEGSLSFPSSGIPDTLEICAENSQAQELVCTGEIQKSDDYTYGFGYQLELPPGEYTVYARLPNDPYRAYYSDFVLCGLNASCPSHKPVIVTVVANMTVAHVDPQDWYDTNQ
ncbi:MAG: hypothetical protein A2632_03175 [Candidatus Pacebacteria bacterium RIFCSPHIGHO2_01_FULL_46_16]|nr:MAG: hypothetical protein A2632_03175 [Candidatus Pacebacteria bacterium RIFCSPHIGHO2_01_FULL_46_16]OGJ21544.1 MAG: hypothetical protein A3J60_03535 [Candidatus Pacebacteria bacterium RIFCSPHIGHO2_02_FULL_46_9]OGJ38986.1 MAG: hypothetical protein A3A82_02490 [Candidatus Pacebacteria bacterium RIFCSPLOWO2_01_FULL_47_12]